MWSAFRAVLSNNVSLCIFVAVVLLLLVQLVQFVYVYRYRGFPPGSENFIRKINYVDAAIVITLFVSLVAIWIGLALLPAVAIGVVVTIVLYYWDLTKKNKRT